ncbi:hypothetical protein [Mesorhizobium sp. M0618]|uniref:TolB family protein n=1 Tax=unclassified Mesorhizobium TaxID=325217 RepID=UPI0033393E19
MALAPDQARFAYVANDEGWNRIFIRDIATGAEQEAMGFPPGVIASIAWTPDGTGLIFPLEGAATPPDIWRFDVAKRKVEQITRASKAGVDTADFIEPTVERIESFDGLAVALPRDRRGAHRGLRLFLRRFHGARGSHRISRALDGRH